MKRLALYGIVRNPDTIVDNNSEEELHLSSIATHLPFQDFDNLGVFWFPSIRTANVTNNYAGRLIPIRLLGIYRAACKFKVDEHPSSS